MKDIEGNGVMVTTDTVTVNAPPAFLFALLNPDLFMRGWSGEGNVYVG